jgi:MFS family permease
MVKDIRTNFEQIGLAATLALVVYGAGSMIGGPLSDRIGCTRVIEIGSFFVGASTLIMLRAFDIAVLGIGMMFVSFGASFYHPTANRLITEIFKGKVGNAMGIHGALGNLGQFLTPTIAFWVGMLFGWRSVFVLMGFLTATVGLLFETMKIPRILSSRNDLRKIAYLVRNRGLMVATFYLILGALSYQGIVFFLPTFLLVERAVNRDIAAYAYSIMLLVGVAGEFLFGRASDKYGCKRIAVLTNLGAFLGLVVLLTIPFPPLAVTLFILIYGVSVFGNEPAVTSLVGGIMPREYSGLVYGLMFTLAFGLGSVSTTIAGYFADRYSLAVSYYAMTVITVVTAIFSFGLPTAELPAQDTGGSHE